MTIVAALAIHPSLGGRIRVAVFADSRASNANVVEDGHEKTIRVTPRCYAALAGPREPLLQLAALVAHEVSNMPAEPSLWECTGLLLRHIRAERRRLEIPDDRETKLVVAGFMRDGSPAAAQAALGGPNEDLFLFIPQEGEAVARVVGPETTQDAFQNVERGRDMPSITAANPSDSVGVLAEALRVGIASGCKFDVALSVLQDMSSDPSLRSIGGKIWVGHCGSSGYFEIRTADVADFTYDPHAYQDLDAEQQSQPFFTGGQPAVSWLQHPPLSIGYEDMFNGDEPPFIAAGDPVPVKISTIDFATHGLNQVLSGMTEQEKLSIARHSPSESKSKRNLRTRRGGKTKPR